MQWLIKQVFILLFLRKFIAVEFRTFKIVTYWENIKPYLSTEAGYFGGEGKKMWGDVRGGWKKVINFAIYSVWKVL